MDREAIRRAFQSTNYDAILAAYEAIVAEFDWLPPEGDAARDLMIQIRISQYREDFLQDAHDRDRWDRAFTNIMSDAVVVVRELDEARRQLAEAREQLHKIGKKAFWAGREAKLGGQDG